MPCKCVHDRLSDYVDGDMGTVERLAVGLHLERCEECRRACRSLEETMRILRLLSTKRCCVPRK